jgi:hypothetical protein
LLLLRWFFKIDNSITNKMLAACDTAVVSASRDEDSKLLQSNSSSVRTRLLFCVISIVMVATVLLCYNCDMAHHGKMAQFVRIRFPRAFNALPRRVLRAKRGDDIVAPVLDERYIEDIEFIFGYSTGHVGTSSFAKRGLYGEGPRQESIFFRHEFSENRISHKTWLGYTEKDEYDYVRQHMFPTIMETLKDKQLTFFDNGHHNLYFIYGLLRYLKEIETIKPTFRYRFLRIRRNRVESALSLEHSRSHKHDLDPVELMIRFHPFERPNDVILKIPQATWDKFSNYQKSLWVVDETEARWQWIIKKKYPSLKYTDVYWESTPGLSNNTFNEAVRAIANVLGIPKSDITYESESTRPHMTDEERKRVMEGRAEMKREDEAYQATLASLGYKIDFSYLPPTYNSYETPSNNATALS